MPDLYGRCLVDEDGEVISIDVARSRTPPKTPLPAGKRRLKHWTRAEDTYLRREWGEVSLRRLAHHLHRSPMGILNRARRLRLPAPGQGRESLSQLERRSGYDVTTLQLAAAHLGITFEAAIRSHCGARCRPLMQPPVRRGIDEDKASAVLAYLASKPDGARTPSLGQLPRGAWGGGARPPACLDCTRSDRPHYARGLCKACAQAAYRARFRARHAA